MIEFNSVTPRIPDDSTAIRKALWDKTHGINNQINQSLYYIEHLCHTAEKTRLFADYHNIAFSKDNIKQYKRMLKLLVREAQEEFIHIENLIEEIEKLDNKLHPYDKNGYVTQISDNSQETLREVLNINLITDDKLI